MIKFMSAIFSLIALSGCAVNDYKPLPGVDGSGQKVALNDCTQKAFHEHFYADNGGSVAAGGLIGGAVGAIVAEQVSASTRPAMDVLIADCMREHGFEGHSEN